MWLWISVDYLSDSGVLALTAGRTAGPVASNILEAGDQSAEQHQRIVPLRRRDFLEVQQEHRHAERQRDQRAVHNCANHSNVVIHV